jgi:hypothetical protein
VYGNSFLSKDFAERTKKRRIIFTVLDIVGKTVECVGFSYILSIEIDFGDSYAGLESAAVHSPSPPAAAAAATAVTAAVHSVVVVAVSSSSSVAVVPMKFLTVEATVIAAAAAVGAA